MQSSVTTLASLLERTFPAGLSGLIFDCDGVMVDSRDVNIGIITCAEGSRQTSDYAGTGRVCADVHGEGGS